MKDNASKIPCDFITNPKDEKYCEHIRNFQGCPTVAITKGGRIFLGWYSGGTQEPDMENYNLLVYSDDLGKTWSEPVLVIPSSKELFIHCIDIQLWVSPEGKLYIYWVQNNTDLAENPKPKLSEGQPWVCHDGYQFCDFVHAEWVSVCENPDVDFYDGKIYLTYDRERMGEAEILLSVFTEDDIMNNGYEFEIQIISKPKKI